MEFVYLSMMLAELLITKVYVLDVIEAMKFLMEAAFL
jgi:hypothetical protein